MIFFLYNILLVCALPVLVPVLLVACLLPKYRGRILRRLGLGLTEAGRNLAVAREKKGPTIWLQALSVGELLSAEPLVRALRAQEPHAVLVLSTTTRSGETLARTRLQDAVDIILPFPLDFWPVVDRFQKVIRPHLFILVETDIWPNFLLAARQKSIACFFVNCRISASSWRWFCRFRFLFLPVFKTFDKTFTQTGADARRLEALGLDPSRVATAGNLKYDAVRTACSSPVHGKDNAKSLLPAGLPIIIAGSTHAGEERIILDAISELTAARRIFLVIAPRDPGRAGQIRAMAEKAGIAVFLRSGRPRPGATLMILDTIGELAPLYSAATIAFVGGSLVDAGGHNPLEASAAGIPVLFGPFMDDFAEIAASLVTAGAAFQIRDKNELLAQCSSLLDDPFLRARTGAQGEQAAAAHHGAAAFVASDALRSIKHHEGWLPES